MRTTSRRLQERLRSAADAADITHPLLLVKPGRMPVYAVVEFAVVVGLDPVMLFQSCEGFAQDVPLAYAKSA